LRGVFDDFDELPAVTAFVLAVSRALRRYWYLSLPGAGLLSAALIIFYMRMPRHRSLLLALYAMVGWLLLAAGVITVVFAVFMPLIRLMEGMSGA
jgi:hypothetical protein